jgi:chorismate mutase
MWMGFLAELLGLPLLPLRGVVAVAEQVQQQAEEEYYDPGRIRAQLEEVDRQRAEGSLSDEEAEAWEEELVERLIEGQRRVQEE